MEILSLLILIFLIIYEYKRSETMRLLSVLILTVCLVFGCESFREPTGNTGIQGKTGTLIVNVVWPAGVIGKNAEITRSAPDEITAYLYRLGKEVTHSSFEHEGSYGTAELTVNAVSGYRLEIVATNWYSPDALYTGRKNNVTVLEDTVTSVEITMSDTAPVLSFITASDTEDSSYTFSWNRVYLTESYYLEESPTSEFIDDYSRSLSTTFYSGSDLKISFNSHEPGTFYYAVFAVTSYSDYFYRLPEQLSNYAVYDYFKYGAISNIIPVTFQSDGGQEEPVTKTGTLKIKIPWPTE